MANITVSINDVLGKLHDQAKAETAKMGKSWVAKLKSNWGSFLLNSGVSEYTDKSSKFTGDTTSPLYIRVIRGNWFTSTWKEDTIRKMVAKYIELFSGMKNANPTLTQKAGPRSDIGLGGNDTIHWYEVEYKIDLVKVKYTLPETYSKMETGDGKTDDTESAEPTDASSGSSSSSSSSSGSSDKRNLKGDSEIEVASNNLSLAEMYREAKLISENAFFESRPFVEKSEKSNLVVEFLK